MTKTNDREIVVPGEVLGEGEVLPGEGTEKQGDKVIALRYGLIDKNERLIRVIPLSGVYHARRGNIVIGKVEEVTFNGWVIDINTAERAFLPISEYPGYVNKKEMDSIMSIGDMCTLKIWGVNKRGIDLSMKSRGLRKIEEGLIMVINPNKVPRVIGKEGSMIKLIKSETGCNITIGQNGLAWIKGDDIENELLAKKAIQFVTEKSFISGLTDKVEEWFKKQKGNTKKDSKESKEKENK